MPTILDPGTVRLSNADVLHWLAQKKTQHASDAASDKSAGRKKSFLPDNYQRALRKHERELKAHKYPYTDNPGAYLGDNRIESMRVFVEKLDERILEPLDEKYRGIVAMGEKSEAQAMKLLEKEQEAKGLSEAELLQVYNLAPQAVEILQNIVVDWEERFTAEEMEVVVQTVGEVFRCGERLPETETSSNGN
jgi:hypothetical protein